jgi:hypothetical protein
MSQASLQNAQAKPAEQPSGASAGFDPYDSGVDLERLRMQRRRTLDDMRRLDEELRLQRSRDRLRMLRGDLPR